jgi:hypothetical protein
MGSWAGCCWLSRQAWKWWTDNSYIPSCVGIIVAQPIWLYYTKPFSLKFEVEFRNNCLVHSEAVGRGPEYKRVDCLGSVGSISQPYRPPRPVIVCEDVWGSRSILASVLDGSEWSASSPGRFTPGGRTPSTHWIGGWVCPRADLNDMEKRRVSSPCRELSPATLSRRPLLYRNARAKCRVYVRAVSTYRWYRAGSVSGTSLFADCGGCLPLISYVFMLVHAWNGRSHP